jgi:hypothetical protein
MKKIIKLHESDLVRIVQKILSEDEKWECVTSDLKDCKINNQFKNKTDGEVKKSISENGKFKVTYVNGDVKFNGKPGKIGAILTPMTTIEMCPSSSVLLSGMGMPECALKYTPNGIEFLPQHA